MKAAIFCPGPSLLRHVDRLDSWTRYIVYDCTWSINTALKLVRADWLAAGDTAFFSGLLGDHRPQVGVLTLADNRPTITSDPSWAGRQVVTWGDVRLIAEHQRRGRPINWSLQTALCHATQLGAKRIDLYGCDLAGTADATGYAGEDRTDDRWARERADLDFTTALIAEHGVTVHRITP